MYDPDSLEKLQKSGIDLQQHEKAGIDPNDFAELMITSGLVLVEEIVVNKRRMQHTARGASDFVSDCGWRTRTDG